MAVVGSLKSFCLPIAEVGCAKSDCRYTGRVAILTLACEILTNVDIHDEKWICHETLAGYGCNAKLIP